MYPISVQSPCHFLCTWPEQHVHPIGHHGIQSRFSSPISLSLTISQISFTTIAHGQNNMCTQYVFTITMSDGQNNNVHPIGPSQSRFSSPISLYLIPVHSLSLNPPHFRFISSSSWHAIKMFKLGFLAPLATLLLYLWLSPPLAHYHDNMCAPYAYIYFQVLRTSLHPTINMFVSCFSECNAKSFLAITCHKSG